MTKTRLRFPLLCLLLCCLTGCKGQKNQPPAPFSALTWNASYEDVKEAHGNEIESYPSVYEGTTYVYEAVYQERNGTLKYMFDSEEKLMCIAWAYETDDPEDLESVYRSLKKEVEDVHGESCSPSAASGYGDVWYLQEGDIILTAVSVQDGSALQYAYLNAAVSNQEKRRTAVRPAGNHFP